jgi:prepilin peptidase CpaA
VAFLPVPVFVVLVSVVIATITDLRAFKIHNRLTLPLLVTGLVYHGVYGGGGAFLNSLLGAAFGFGILFLFYLIGGMGGGDVKLMAGVGAWLGMPLTFWIFNAAAIAAGAYALILIILNGRLGETRVRFQLMWYRIWAVGRQIGGEDRIESEVRRDDRRQRLIPFGAMVGVGLVVLLTIAWLRPTP